MRGFQNLWFFAVVVTTIASSSSSSSSLFANGNEEEWKPKVSDSSQSQSDLFSLPQEIQVVGPTSFPKPTDMLYNETMGGHAQVVVEPTFGTHRPDRDVVMAYAEGYTLPYYMMFIETLRDTGFDGDIVLAIAYYGLLSPDVEDYLRSKDNVIVYIQELHCYESDNITPAKRLMKRGSLDIFQMCHLHHVYGWKDPTTGATVETALDPRIGRVVATIRYEWYWIWAQYYNPNVWIMLIDARDSIFQSNPFADLPRNQNGLLYFFGEHADSTRLGKSRKNANWLRGGYGESTLKVLSDKPTICSGSTMGEQLAIDTYLRAMVNENDETDIRMTGSDQGFHNYLYYSGKLASASHSIQKIVVWEQGKSIINNLSALRVKSLYEWGIYNPKTCLVYNWDGTLSPVAHQFDRDKSFFDCVVRKKHREWQRQWEGQKESAKAQVQ